MFDSGPMPKPDTDLLSPGDVALILRRSTQTVNRWGKAGLLGEIVLTEGGQRRYRREAVEAFLLQDNNKAS